MTISPYLGSNGVTCTTTHLPFVQVDGKNGIFFQHRRFKNTLGLQRKPFLELFFTGRVFERSDIC